MPMAVVWIANALMLGVVVALYLFASWAIAKWGFGFAIGGFMIACCYQFAHRMIYGRWF